MTTVVVPFAGTEGKTRLDASRGTRRDLSLAMLADVLAATVVVGRTLVVTGDADGPTLAADARVETVAVAVPNLAEDVDTLADLERLQLRCGPRTQAVLSALSAGIAP